jgi:hypothetical protein
VRASICLLSGEAFHRYALEMGNDGSAEVRVLRAKLREVDAHRRASRAKVREIEAHRRAITLHEDAVILFDRFH